MLVSRQVIFAKREIQQSQVQYCAAVTGKSLHIPDKRMDQGSCDSSAVNIPLSFRRRTLVRLRTHATGL